MIKILENITKEDLEKAVKNSNSYNGVKEKIGLSSSKQSRDSLIKKIKDLDISISHFYKNRKEYIKKDQLIEAVRDSFSIAEVFSKLGLDKYNGGHYRSFRRWKKEFSLDTSHFLGKSISKGKKGHGTARYSFKEILVINSPYQGGSHSLKRRLLKAGLLIYHCYDCGIFEWKNKELALQLDHINGENDDNRIENLRLLCPNCHTQTKTWGSKNIKNKK